MTNWYSNSTPQETDRLLSAWPGAPIENAELCGMLLAVAKGQVLSYAPSTPVTPADLSALTFNFTVDDGVVVGMEVSLSSDAIPAGYTGSFSFPVDAQDLGTDTPVNYVYAQLQQAKNLWAAGMADPEGNIGTEGYSFQPRPLDKTIKSIIRPTSGAASVL